MPFNTPNDATYDLLMNRRSVKAKDMVGPGPDRSAMEKILAAGMRVPDHGKLNPWRFLVLTGADREKLGDLIAEGLVIEDERDPKVAEKMKGYASQGPVLVVAIMCINPDHKIPVMEQELSIGAACQNMLVAATALGYASQWLTGWAAYSKTVSDGLGLGENEKIAGFLFFGNQDRDPSERPRPDINDHITWSFPESKEA
ncbi:MULTISPECIES: nitroreductase family protein [Kordiimonas]|jgi:nitroreductase|uniref:nitroreductase family protein n=1 Tax=Kordiimonas TaxID=288021 RepID=UPI00257FEE88|nr:nitroreductase [Kordiimonas sp. UBA4487]